MSTDALALIYIGIAISVGGCILWYNETPKPPNIKYVDKPVHLKKYMGQTSDGDSFEIDFDENVARILCKDKKNSLHSKTMKFGTWYSEYTDRR